MSYQTLLFTHLRKWAIIFAYAILLLVYYWIFGAFFPNKQGFVGHDYSFVLPQILDSYFWFRNNPIYEIPWFTPSFCGGQPFFANAGGIYFMLPTLFAMILDPLRSIVAAFLVVAAIGSWGMHRLLRDVFDASEKAALLGGALFLFNGFYAHRMLVGHSGYQAFMLLPWVVWALLIPVNAAETQRIRWLENCLRVTLAGGLLAYWVFSGFVSLAIPAGLTIMALAGLCLASHDRWRLFFIRSAASFTIVLALAASALSAGQAFLSHFPRDDYLLPGIDGIMRAMVILFEVLFLSPPHIEEIVTPRLSNLQWQLGRHEWEFGMTVVPLLLILLSWGSVLLARRGHPVEQKPMNAKYLAAISMLGISLIIPLAVNIYSPEWNSFLKQLPMIKNSSNLIRWWIVYIPVTIVCAALALDRLGWSERNKTGLLLGSILLVIYLNATQERSFYHRQSYDPKVTADAYWATKRGDFTPEVRKIGATVNKDGRLVMLPNRNDLLVNGESQLACYNPSFGYGLERLPIKTLHPGSIYEETDGRLNLKNPACYVFPEENNCQPGDHFLNSQIAEAHAFAQYKPFHFEISSRQGAANWISSFAIFAVPLLFVISWASLVLARKRQGGGNLG